MKKEKKKKSFVDIIALTFVILSAYTLFSVLLQIFSLFKMKRDGVLQPFIETITASHNEAIYFIVDHFISITVIIAFISLFSLFVSLALLHRKEWARKTFRGILFLAVLGSAAGLFFTFPTTSNHPSNSPELVNMINKMQFAIEWSIRLLSFFSLLLHGWMMWKFNTSAVRQEFLKKSASDIVGKR